MKQIGRFDIYTILGWVAMIAVPISPVFFFSHGVYTAVNDMTVNTWLSLLIAVVSGIGLEILGILAGHTAMEFWRNGDNLRAGISGGIMLVYVAIGTIELWGKIGAVMFLIAPLVYVLVALRRLLEKQEAQANQTAVFELNERAKDRQLSRDIKLLQVQNKIAGNQTVSMSFPVNQIGNQETNQETAKERMKRTWKPGMQPTELARQANVSKGYASKYISNGARVHWDSINGG